MPKQLDLTNATVEEIAQYALENADMSCVDDAVVFLGDSGVGKDTVISDALGCTLKYVKIAGRWCLEIVTCPDGVKKPEIGFDVESKTLLPAMYVEAGQKNPLHFLNMPGFRDNGNSSRRLLTLLGTQVAIKTTRSIKAIVVVVRAENLKNRFTAFDEVVKTLSGMFKGPLESYEKSIKLHIGLSRNDTTTKEDILARLKSFHHHLETSYTKSPTLENLKKQQLVSLFLKEGNTKNIFLFRPGVIRTEFLDNIRQSPSFPSSDNDIVGTEEIKQQFLHHMDGILLKGTQLFNTLLTTPAKIAEQIKKAEALTAWLRDNATLEDDSAQGATPFANKILTIQETINQTRLEINQTGENKIALNTTRHQIIGKITALLEQKELTTFHRESWSEREEFGTLKDPYWYERGTGCWPWPIMYCHTQRTYYPGLSIARVVTIPDFTAPEPFTHVKVEFVKTCDRGGAAGTYEDKAEPQNRTYTGGKYVTPSTCNGGYTVELQRPYNENAEQKRQLQLWKTDLETNGKDTTQCDADLLIYQATLDDAEANLASVLLDEANSEINRKSVAAEAMRNLTQAKRVALNTTRETIRSLQALDNESHTIFFRNQSSYRTIQTFNDIIGFNSTHYQAFLKLYARTQRHLNITVLNGTTHHCHQATPNQSTSDDFSFEDLQQWASTPWPEETCVIEADETRSFGIPGAKASSMRCLVIGDETPPKSSSISGPIISGATNGFFRGAANVVGKAISPANFTKRATYVVQSLVHDAFYLTMRSQAHIAEGQPLETALIDASIETLQMQALSLSTLLVSHIGQKAKEKGLKQIGGALNFFARAIPYVHMGIQQEIINTKELKIDTDKLIDGGLWYETGASVLSAMFVQKEVEHHGDQLFSKGPQ